MGYGWICQIFQTISDPVFFEPWLKENPHGCVSNIARCGEARQNGLLALPPLLT
jgi:hypothetical protein